MYLNLQRFAIALATLVVMLPSLDASAQVNLPLTRIPTPGVSECNSGNLLQLQVGGEAKSDEGSDSGEDSAISAAQPGHISTGEGTAIGQSTSGGFISVSEGGSDLVPTVSSNFLLMASCTDGGQVQSTTFGNVTQFNFQVGGAGGTTGTMTTLVTLSGNGMETGNAGVANIRFRVIFGGTNLTGTYLGNGLFLITGVRMENNTAVPVDEVSGGFVWQVDEQVESGQNIPVEVSIGTWTPYTMTGGGSGSAGINQLWSIATATEVESNP